MDVSLGTKQPPDLERGIFSERVELTAQDPTLAVCERGEYLESFPRSVETSFVMDDAVVRQVDLLAKVMATVPRRMMQVQDQVASGHE